MRALMYVTREREDRENKEEREESRITETNLPETKKKRKT
jgi:hypothetical protein